MPDPGALPDTKRVDASRRGPVLVVLGSVIIVGLLVWKPWSPPVAPPTLSPVAVAPTPERSSPGVQIDIDSLVNLDGTMVRCEYATGEGGESVLAGLVVAPPHLEPRPDVADADVLEVSWRAEVQRNGLDSIFSANWEQVTLSNRQISPAITSPFTEFQPMSLDYEEATPAASVLRVVIIVEWYGPRRALLGSGSFVVATYDTGESRPPRIEGCHTVIVG